MKNKKGFTLIELLAVIVVLAIIALISIPIVSGVIDKATMGSTKDSAYGIIEAANIFYAESLSKGISISKDGDHVDFVCRNNECTSQTGTIKYNGKIDNGSLRLYSDGNVSICIENDKYGASKLATEKKVTLTEGSCDDDYKIVGTVSKTKYDEVKAELEETKTKLNNVVSALAPLVDEEITDETDIASVTSKVVNKVNSATKFITIKSGDSGRTISSFSRSYDVKTILSSTPEYAGIDSTKLTNSNFIVSIRSYSRLEYLSGSKTKGGGGAISTSYNTTSGVLTVSFPIMSAAFTSGDSYAVCPMDLVFDVYLIA